MAREENVIGDVPLFAVLDVLQAGESRQGVELAVALRKLRPGEVAQAGDGWIPGWNTTVVAAPSVQSLEVPTGRPLPHKEPHERYLVVFMDGDKPITSKNTQIHSIPAPWCMQAPPNAVFAGGLPPFLVAAKVSFDVDAVWAMLREADLVCVPANLEEVNFDPYHWPEYVVQDHYGCKFQVLLDLNLLREILSLHPSFEHRIEIGEQQKVAAAFMAAAINAGITLEPGLALREWFTEEEDEKFRVQLARFRQLDNANPSYFARIALGESQAIPEVPEITVSPGQTLTERPATWTRSYAGLLKVALLTLEGERQGTKSVELMGEFLRWCWEDFVFSAPTIHYASLYLSPKRRKRMFKSLRSPDPERALKGVRNAAWDLAYLRYWTNLVHKKDNTFHIFGSLDQALRDSARDMLRLGEEVPRDFQATWWTRLWGHEGKGLFQHYEGLVESIESPARRSNQDDWEAEEKYQEAVGRLEAELCSLIAG